MAKSNALETAFLKLLYQAVTHANVAINATSSPITSVYVALHTSSPADTGNQSTNETSYGGYARVGVARTTAGWTVTNNSVSPAAAIEFPQATSGTATITHFSTGKASSGATEMFHHGTVTPNIAVAAGVTPRLTTATAITES